MKINEMKTQRIIGNCPLCGQKALHVLSLETSENQQCISSGYVSSDAYKLKENESKDNHELYLQLTDDMKEWSVVENNRIWIPTMMTLPVGILYPSNDDSNTMIWNFAPMVNIPEEERKNFPDEQGGFYKQKYDTENSLKFEWFAEALNHSHQKMKENTQNPGGNLPKLEFE